MANEYLISVAVKADFIQLRVQQAEAAAAVKKATAEMETAYRELGAVLNSSNKEAAAAAQVTMGQYQAKVDAARASLLQITAAVRELSSAQKANAASTSEDTVAIVENTAATQSNTNARRQAYDATYAFTGSTYGAARAIADFTSRFPALQGAISAAFDVAIVFAFAEMAARAGKALYTLSMNAENLATELHISWFEGVIGQMNGLAAATKSADKEALKLAQDQDKSVIQTQQIEAQHIALTQGAAAADRYRASLERAYAAKQTKGLLAAEQAQLQSDQKESTVREDITINTNYGLIKVGSRLTPKAELAKKRIKNDNIRIGLVQQAIANAETKAEDFDIQAQKSGKTGSVSSASIVTTPTPFTGDYTASQLINGKPEPRSVIYEERERDAQNRQRVLDHAPTLTEFLDYGKQTESQQLEGITGGARQQERGYDDTEASSMKVAEFRERMGQISPRQAAAQESSAVKTNETSTVGALQGAQAKIAPLSSLLGQYAPMDAKQLAAYQQLQNQIVQATQQAANKQEQIASQLALKQEQTYQKLFQNITGPLNQFTDHWLQSGNRMAAAFQKMYDELAMEAINYEIKRVEKHLWGDLKNTLSTELSNTTQVASTGVAAAQTAAIETQSAMKSLAKSAAKAAGKAWSALADIPIVGPELGAIAAAATFTGVMALAAFKDGADMIPRSGIAMLHPGEAIATAGENSRISKVIEMAARGGVGGADGAHFHYSPNVNGIDGASVEGMVKTHANTFKRQMMRELRKMNKI